MKDLHRIFWGLCLIAIALVIVLNSVGLLEVTLSVGKIITGIIAVAIILGGISEKEFGGIFLGIGILWISFGSLIGLPFIGVWPMLLVVMLLTCGFHFLFPKKMNHHDEEWAAYENENMVGEHQRVTESENNGYLYCSNTFGSLAKYANSSDFKGAKIENSFGELKVYFDNTVIINSPITITINNSFGSIHLFMPRHWNVESDIKLFAANGGHSTTTYNPNGPTVRIDGSISFGDLKITYI